MSRALAGELRSLGVRLAQFEDKYLASAVLSEEEKKFIIESIAYYRKQVEDVRAQMNAQVAK